MPTAPARPCPRPMCPHRVPCPTHGDGKATSRERRQAEPWRALYDTARWKRLRLQKLAANPACECDACAALPLPRLASVVDHRTPHRGEAALFFAWDNLQSMAKRCHDAKTAGEMNRSRRC
jgi:5-methylcytosine-specific restriction protein A